MVRQGRAGMAAYTVSPSTSPTVASPLGRTTELEASSGSSSVSNPTESPVRFFFFCLFCFFSISFLTPDLLQIAASVRESVTWEHSVSQAILSFAEDKKAAAQGAQP
jgi:hypothetical protein